jgi:hypothetical protein
MSATERRKGEEVASTPPLSMKELSQVLAKHYGLPPGKYDLRIEFQIGTGPVGPENDRLPGMVLGIKSIGLGRVQIESDSDAREPEPEAVVQKAQAAPRRKKTEKA